MRTANANNQIKTLKPGKLPRSKLLRIDLLYAFEAAARLLSFTKAATELSLTQSAISRQIQQLEENLHSALFIRTHRAIALTPAGRILHRAVSDSFERLLDAQARIHGTTQSRQVSVSCTPGFASLWLIPRLATFTANHPQVDVRISAVYEVIDIEKTRIDVAVRFAPIGSAKGAALFEETVMPMCAPKLVKVNKAILRKPSDLEAFTLLAADMPNGESLTVDWDPWLRVMGITQLHMKSILRFSQYSDAIAAAVAGQGVVIGRLPLLKEYLKDGRLVAPFQSNAANTRRGYFVMLSARAENNRDAQDFARWLHQEADQTMPSPI
jgi:LysR family transcriptional regulator, glycine cleavage system transcriptional activator